MKGLSTNNKENISVAAPNSIAIYNQGRKKLAQEIIEKLEKEPKPHLANYLYKENGETKTGTTTVMR